jgi:hypothetical protein
MRGAGPGVLAAGYKSFEHHLEAKFPDCWRRAYYLKSIHDHLKQIPTPEIEDLGWAKALELAKVARHEGRGFNSAAQLDKAKGSCKDELRREVYKHLSGENYEPLEMVYFKLVSVAAKKGSIVAVESGPVSRLRCELLWRAEVG